MGKTNEELADLGSSLCAEDGEKKKASHRMSPDPDTATWTPGTGLGPVTALGTLRAAKGGVIPRL